MTQLLASMQDINKWLDDSKVVATDASTSQFQLEASRIVKSKLSGVFTPVVLFGWDSPQNTPGIIRSIAGELIAAYYYRELYSEDVTDVPQYAQMLYNEAISMLNEIRTGSLVVLDENDEPIGGGSSLIPSDSTDLWPNDTTAGPYFTMDSVWG